MSSSSSPDRVLQEELKDAGNRLLVPPSSTYELLSLLDKVEHLLFRVEQAPSRSTQEALLPLMNALIAPELLRHSEVDVNVSVVSCINEITRVTAPDAPYNDEQMKEIFKLTVRVLEKLSLASGHCYTKAVSILGTIATVRSCLVMLDLECDELIIEMVQLFLNTIRSDHPYSVFSDMETIMTLVIEESEEIPLELLIPLLSSVRNENQNVSPLSWKLGESVLKKCAAKLKPYLPPAVQFMGIDLNDFAEIVFAICQYASGREHLVAEVLAPEAVCPGRAGTSVDGLSSTFTNDNHAQIRGDGMSLKTLECCQSKSTDARSDAHPDHLDSTKAVNPGTEPESVPNKRGRKPNSLIKPEEGYDHSWLSGGRKALPPPLNRKNHEKRVGSSSTVSVAKKAALSETRKETKLQFFLPNASSSENIDASPSQYHNFPDESHHKRGQPNKKGNLMNQDGDLGLLLVPNGDLLSPQEKASQSADITSMKESEITRNLKAKPERGSRKNAISAKTNVQTITALGNAVFKKEDGFPSDPEGKKEATGPQIDGKKQNRGNAIFWKHATQEFSGKKAVSLSAPRSLNKDESQLEETSKTKCKRKGTQQKEEVSEMTRDTENYGEELVGCDIKVWWPLDGMFYEGVIYSFDPIEKKHKVLYADGDKEILDLTMEHWILVQKKTMFLNKPQKKKAKTKSESSTKQENDVSSSKSASNGKSKVGRPKM